MARLRVAVQRGSPHACRRSGGSPRGAPGTACSRISRVGVRLQSHLVRGGMQRRSAREARESR